MTRLDQRMVQEGLVPSRARAQALIAGGMVLVGGRRAAKASDRADGQIEVMGPADPWVSRAAQKLLHALDHFELAPSGIALDLGASTGGFTQVLLARGATLVHAVDVGHGQMHADIAGDDRTVVYERTNAKNLPTDRIPPPDWITCDLSFISLEKALPISLKHAKNGAYLIALIKPQFEAGPDHIGKGGIVRDASIQHDVCMRIQNFLSIQGWTILGLTNSPITGSDGNREFLITAQKPTA
ncbi:MAG: TlyA family RNA methyltransferase [Pseudomonadota bacterium]